MISELSKVWFNIPIFSLLTCDLYWGRLWSTWSLTTAWEGTLNQLNLSKIWQYTFESFRFNDLKPRSYLLYTVFVYGNILTILEPWGFDSTFIHQIWRPYEKPKLSYCDLNIRISNIMKREEFILAVLLLWPRAFSRWSTCWSVFFWQLCRQVALADTYNMLSNIMTA